MNINVEILSAVMFLWPMGGLCTTSSAIQIWECVQLLDAILESIMLCEAGTSASHTTEHHLFSLHSDYFHCRGN